MSSNKWPKCRTKRNEKIGGKKWNESEWIKRNGISIPYSMASVDEPSTYAYHRTPPTIVAHFPNGSKRTVKKIENYIWRLILYIYSTQGFGSYVFSELRFDHRIISNNTKYILSCSSSCMQNVSLYCRVS